VTFALAFVLSAHAGKPFDLVTDPLVTLPAGEGTTLEIRLRMTEEKKIYKDMVAIEVKDADELTVGAIVLPEGKTIPDPMGTAPREVYANDTVLAVPVAAPADAHGTSVLSLLVRFQGCSPSMCYAPMDQTVKIRVRVLSS
jgi:hypothetical protein